MSEEYTEFDRFIHDCEWEIENMERVSRRNGNKLLDMVQDYHKQLADRPTVNEKQCDQVARMLFELGDESMSKTQRIEFKGEEDTNGNERCQGGLCESSFSKWLFKALSPPGVSPTCCEEYPFCDCAKYSAALSRDMGVSE